jgi:hypothetical protein
MTNTPRSPRVTDWCRCEDGRWHQWLPDICTPGPDDRERGDVVPVTPFLGAALDQLYLQRRLLAFVSHRLEIALSSPMSAKKRGKLADLIVQMRLTARGNPRGPLLGRDVSRVQIQTALAQASWDGTLTRSEWESQTFRQEVTW